MHCVIEMLGVGEKVNVCGAWRCSGSVLKLFGREIPPVSTAVMNIRSKKRHMEDSLVISNDESCGPPSEQDTVFSDPGEEKHGLDEIGSSSGSNDGFEEEKRNQATIGCPESLDGAEPGVEAGAGSTDPRGEAKGVDGEGDAIQEKTPGKPDKPLPCPRCDSLDTKFCYYNNYNVNQPRHFCKHCQRYWTAGGTLRNVPVGAGRRKNKHSASHQRHVLPDIMAVRGDSVDCAHQRISCSVSTPQSKLGASHSRLPLLPPDVCSLTALDSPPSSTVLNFGQESPLCESMAATSLTVHRTTGFQNQRSVSGRTVLSVNVVEAGSDPCCKSSVDQKPYVGSEHFSLGKMNEETAPSVELPTRDNSMCGSSVTIQPTGKGTMALENKSEQTDRHEGNANIEGQAGWEHGASFMTYGGPWQYGLNMVWSNAAAAVASTTGTLEGNNGASSALTAPPPNSFGWNGAPPGGLWPCVPWPVLHPALWAAPPSEWAGSWSMPWVPAAAATSAAAAAATAPWLANTNRKHRMESLQSESESEGCLWVPKTLRIDDPAEAAQSSIWTTLGLGDRSGSLTVGGASKGFCTKTETKETEEPAAQAPRHINPAAMTRSMAFHENS